MEKKRWRLRARSTVKESSFLPISEWRAFSVLQFGWISSYVGHSSPQLKRWTVQSQGVTKHQAALSNHSRTAGRLHLATVVAAKGNHSQAKPFHPTSNRLWQELCPTVGSSGAVTSSKQQTQATNATGLLECDRQVAGPIIFQMTSTDRVLPLYRRFRNMRFRLKINK